MSTQSTEKVTTNNFTTRVASSGVWKTIVSAVKNLVEEATFAINSDGISFRAMDPSHVGLVDIHLAPNAFEKFECEKENTFCVMVEDFEKIMRRAGKDDTVEISRSGEDALVIKIRKSKAFELHLIQSEKATTPLPKLTYNANIGILTSTLNQAIADVSVVANQVTISADPNSVVFSGKGDTGTAKSTFNNPEDLINLTCSEAQKSTYSLEYLVNMVGAMKDVETTILEFATKLPLRLTLNLEDKAGMVQFYLAGRVQE